MKTWTNKGTIRQGEVTQTNDSAGRRTEMLAMAEAWKYEISIKNYLISKT